MASKEGSVFETNLEYSIFNCSSYSSSYVPENIIVDRPSDQTSRWSSDNDNHPQFLVLKLQQPSIVKTITFGKYEKAHVCNIRKFKIYGGLELQNMMELLESGLKNDSNPESFNLKHNIDGCKNYFPIQFIKIVLLQSWGPSFNFSIWHVRLTGTDDPRVVKPCIDWLNWYRQKEVIRLCMKHFRKFEQQEVVETLQRATGVTLEDKRLSALYNLLVVEGDHVGAEKFISNSINQGLLSDYIHAQSYQVAWNKLTTSDPKPGMRGGHQMVLDPSAEVLYLFGGWDGNQDLADLWLFDINSSTWTCICNDTSTVGGPSPRSCHKMCLDPERRQLFLLGRYLDTQLRTPENLKSDFYVYDIESNKWTQISEDTASMGGPELIFDHQMTLDIERRTIYVFGGRILSPMASTDDSNTTNSNESAFSGLYSYEVPTSTWKKLACDVSRPGNQNIPSIRSRVGHSMLFHPGARKLYIFAGQRGKEYLNDFFTYEVDTNKVENISSSDLSGKDSSHIPAAGFTQRATIDPELGEIYVLSGLSKDKDKRDENVQNSFWVYSIKKNKWSCIYRNENIGEKYWIKMQNFEPCPRFAHQLVYDNVRKIHYLFGGNPGRSCLPKLRLDDFWQLQLSKPSNEQILKKCKLIIRTHKFEELAASNSFEALEYLQTKVSEIIDHDDEEQTKEFQQLTSMLFCRQKTPTTESNRMENSAPVFKDVLSSPCQTLHVRRTILYDKLAEFYPESLAQPRANLIDLLPL